MISLTTINTDGNECHWNYDSVECLKKEFYSDWPDVPSNDDLVLSFSIDGVDQGWRNQDKDFLDVIYALGIEKEPVSQKTKSMKLYAEWIPNMGDSGAFRLFRSDAPGNTIAYEDDIAVAQSRALEEGYSGIAIRDEDTIDYVKKNIPKEDRKGIVIAKKRYQTLRL